MRIAKWVARNPQLGQQVSLRSVEFLHALLVFWNPRVNNVFAVFKFLELGERSKKRIPQAILWWWLRRHIGMDRRLGVGSFLETQEERHDLWGKWAIIKVEFVVSVDQTVHAIKICCVMIMIQHYEHLGYYSYMYSLKHKEPASNIVLDNGICTCRGWFYPSCRMDSMEQWKDYAI